MSTSGAFSLFVTIERKNLNIILLNTCEYFEVNIPQHILIINS